MVDAFGFSARYLCKGNKLTGSNPVLTTMRFEKYEMVDQIDLIPFIRITYSKNLNGRYEAILGWLNYGICLSW